MRGQVVLHLMRARIGTIIYGSIPLNVIECQIKEAPSSNNQLTITNIQIHCATKRHTYLDKLYLCVLGYIIKQSVELVLLQQMLRT